MVSGAPQTPLLFRLDPSVPLHLSPPAFNVSSTMAGLTGISPSLTRYRCSASLLLSSSDAEKFKYLVDSSCLEREGLLVKNSPGTILGGAPACCQGLFWNQQMPQGNDGHHSSLSFGSCPPRPLSWSPTTASLSLETLALSYPCDFVQASSLAEMSLLTPSYGNFHLKAQRKHHLA